MLYKLKDTIIKVENLSVSYEGKIIIKDINLEELDVTREDKIQGQTIAFLGRSGRGKSTLFRQLTGLESPTNGHVLIPDFDSLNTENNVIRAKKVKEGDVGFVNQKYTLFRNKTVYQALKFANRFSTESPEKQEEEIHKLLQEWGLIAVKNSFPFQLSGGQRQRTAILEQLLCSKHYIVLDEPFSGLDAGNIESVKKAFNLITSQDELNTIIFSTHDIELAVELADSIYIIGYPQDSNGQLLNYGTIVKHFDLKALGLAWSDTMTSEHYKIASDIKTALLQS